MISGNENGLKNQKKHKKLRRNIQKKRKLKKESKEKRMSKRKRLLNAAKSIQKVHYQVEQIQKMKTKGSFFIVKKLD